jgi:hypothetical protein
LTTTIVLPVLTEALRLIKEEDASLEDLKWHRNLKGRLEDIGLLNDDDLLKAAQTLLGHADPPRVGVCGSIRNRRDKEGNMAIYIFRESFVDRLRTSVKDNERRYKQNKPWVDEITKAAASSIQTGF